MELAGKTHAIQPETVAEETLKGITRGRFIILPGSEMKLLYPLAHLVGNGIYPIIDFLVARSLKKQKQQAKILSLRKEE
jgi:hypothetical protein